MCAHVVHVRVLILGLSLLVVGLGSTPALAQPFPETGGRVFGLVGGSFGDGGSAPLLSGGAGLRVTRHLGLDFQVLHAPDLELSGDELRLPLLRRFGPIILPFELERSGDVTAFLTTLTAEFPVAGGRVVPFLSGGGGVGRLAEQIRFRCVGICPALEDRPATDIFPAVFIPDVEQAQTGLALTVGGGLDVMVWRGLAVGGEARWLRMLLDHRELDMAHVAGRVSYRF